MLRNNYKEGKCGHARLCVNVTVSAETKQVL